MHLALIGYRGAGKSTIGPLVALLGQVESVDADQEIERSQGQSIREIFAQGGEPRFRDLETQMLGDLLRRPTCVLSLGGGVILRPENRQLLQSCYCVWLTAPQETILQRLAEDEAKRSQRPSLTALPAFEEVAKLLKQRAPYYAECADLTVDTSEVSAEEAARTILAAWRAHDADSVKR